MKNQTFREKAEEDQIRWKNRQSELSRLPLGKVKVKGDWKRYKHVLPGKAWELNLWLPLRKGGEIQGQDSDLPEYLRKNHVQRHTHSRNLLSSWTLCANLYFPFGRVPDGRKIISRFLSKLLDENSIEVQSVELEYQDTDPSLSAFVLLGEESGKRGSGQTSPDLGIVFTYGAGKKGLMLIENKYVEHSFYPCSANKKNGSSEHPVNTDKTRCQDTMKVVKDYDNQCHQSSWGRKYWKQVAASINLSQIGNLNYCPARTAGYQLFRQQALAEAIVQSGKYQLVCSAVAYDSQNEKLVRCLDRTGIKDAHNDGWAALWSRGKARFVTFNHRQWVEHVKTMDTKHNWDNWLTYIHDRYGY